MLHSTWLRQPKGGVSREAHPDLSWQLEAWHVLSRLKADIAEPAEETINAKGMEALDVAAKLSNSGPGDLLLPDPVHG